MTDLDRDITTFFLRWNALELSRDDGGLVLDFDMAPRPAGQVEPHASRRAALAALERLQDRVAISDTLIDRDLVFTKLAGSSAYLRALLGETIGFEEYLQATMGFSPEPLDNDEILALRDTVEAGFATRGVTFDPAGRRRLGTLFGHATAGEVAATLPKLADHYVTRLSSFLPELPAPDYRISVVEEDAYWANWIDGNLSDGILLKVNTHARISYERRSARMLAAHEIAGHAVHVAGMRSAVAEGRLDACLLNLTVHSCEAFHMEGLAQIALYALSRDGELDDDDELRLRHRVYSGALLNRAQIRIEAGAALDTETSAAIAACPLVNPLTIRSSLRDRTRSPLFRCYIHVYPPALRLFLRFRELTPPARDAFLRTCWTGLMTPSTIRQTLG